MAPSNGRLTCIGTAYVMAGNTANVGRVAHIWNNH
jgi:hypothetical protein